MHLNEECPGELGLIDSSQSLPDRVPSAYVQTRLLEWVVCSPCFYYLEIVSLTLAANHILTLHDYHKSFQLILCEETKD